MPGKEDSSAQAQPGAGGMSSLDSEVFRKLPQPALLVETGDGRIMAVNEAMARLYGRPADSFRSLADICGPEEVKSLQRFLQEEPGPEHHRICSNGRQDGKVLFLEITTARLGPEGSRDRLLLVEDVTQRSRTQREAALFSALGRKLSASRSPREASRAVAEAADELLGWDACLFERCSADLQSVEMILAIDTLDGRKTEVARSAGRAGPIARRVISEGPQLMLRGEQAAAGEPALAFGDTSRLSRSIMAVPLASHGRPIGVISVHSYAPNAYTPEGLRTLAALAEHCSGAFARMRAEDEIARLHGELRRHLEELQTVFEVVPVGIAVAHDIAMKKITFNPACARALGLPPETSSIENLDRRPPPYRVLLEGRELPLEEHPIYRAARSGQAVRLAEYEICQVGGKRIPCLAGASPLFDDSGNARGSLAVVVDITERKAAINEILRLNADLEQRVRERTRQLELTNLELESFSYSVSHDLRAPLRSIRGFSDALLERNSENLDARGRDFLKRVCDSCLQMDRLIEDLLKLSRVNRSELQPGDTDLSTMAGDILGELQKSEPDRKVEIVLPESAPLRADERLLRLAMENLLRNAWKFTRDQPKPRIELGRLKGPEAIFFVKDNGAGFDMAHAQKLFGVFQRLHSTREFPGTGIGLATAQRVIRRHGGRIWAEGAVGRGATFYFTLSDGGSA